MYIFSQNLVLSNGVSAGHWAWSTTLYTAVLATVLGKAALITEYVFLHFLTLEMKLIIINNLILSQLLQYMDKIHNSCNYRNICFMVDFYRTI